MTIVEIFNNKYNTIAIECIEKLSYHECKTLRRKLLYLVQFNLTDFLGFPHT